MCNQIQHQAQTFRRKNVSASSSNPKHGQLIAGEQRATHVEIFCVREIYVLELDQRDN